MRHSSTYQRDFGRAVGKDKASEPALDRSYNEFVNNGQLTQSQLQRFFYRRQNLLSKGQYHLNYMALMELATDQTSNTVSSSVEALDLFDRELIEDFLGQRTITQRNYGDDDRPEYIETSYDPDDFDQDAQDLLYAIQKAERSTGIKQSYLVDLAFKESSFGENMVASTSTARGAYQFIESTWLRTVKEYGDEIGYGHYADLIDTSGRKPEVINEEFKQKILDLRFNHEVAAHMAARFTEDNKDGLQRAFPDRDISNTDLYMAHFLGAGGAINFIREVENNPSQVAASKFSSAANANKWVFYNNDGRALSFDAVYTRFERDFEGNRPVNVAALADRDHLKTVA